MLNAPPQPALMQDLLAFRDEYLKTGRICPGVRPIVRQSWERSRRYGIDPLCLRLQQADPQRLRTAREASRTLLQSADATVQRIHETLADEPHLVALSDANGYILRLLADPVAEAAGGPAANLFEGASWHERDIGCNGIGTCLAIAQPVILIGPEHFQEKYIGWTCIGVPIKGADGSLLGALDLSVPNEHVHLHTWGWVLSIAQSIENRLALANRTTVEDRTVQAAIGDLTDPFNAVRGVLNLLANQSGLSPTHTRFIEQAQLEVDAAAGQMRTSVNQMLAAQQRLRAANRLKDQLLAEHQKATEALQERERQLRFLAESIPHMVWAAQPDGQVDYVNRRVLDYTGARQEELMGWDWLPFIHPDDHQRTVEGWTQSLREGVEFRMDFRTRHGQSGQYRWHKAHALPMRDAEGRILRWYGTCTDIDEQKRTEQALRESEDRFRLAIAATRALVYEIDLTSNRVSGFDGLYELLGYHRDEVPISRDWWFAQMRPDPELTFQNAAEDFQKSDTYSKEYRIRHKDGHYLHVIDQGKVIRDASGTPLRVVGSVTDITQRKLMEAESKRARESAEQANRAKDHFLAVLSHELRTPLTPVLTTVQMLERDRTLNSDLRESVDMIRRNVELEARLIDDLLDLTRISRGKLQLNRQSVDLHEKVYQVVSICESDLRGKQLSLTLHLNADRHHVQGDPARLQQVLWNLLKNAIKFTPFGGSISITTANTDNAIAVAVKDTGIGIEPDRLVRIFDAFEQGGTDITRLFGGLGLGLSICKGLADLHGGSISAFSEGQGKGATFTVELPVSVPVQTAQESGDTGQAQTSALVCRVLLVEDHPDTARILRLLLANFGCTVQVAGSVASALRMAEAEKFDLLISDLGLPDGSGHDLMRQLRLKHPLKGIALSGYGAEEDIRKSQEAGFAAHLTKPINIQHLEELIRQVLAN